MFWYGAIRRVSLVKHMTIKHKKGKDQIVITTNETYPWSSVADIFCNGQPNHDGERVTFEMMIST